MSSSYSALLRRSKLASFNPAIEQVYSSTGASLSRSNFGLKRPLPSKTTAAAPFVRLHALDNAQKRTPFRKATREALLVRKWDELAVQVQSKADGDLLPQEYRTVVQSRFVPDGFGNGIGSGATLGERLGGGVPEPAVVAEEAARLAGRAPDFLGMSEGEFDDWLAGLTSRREEFAEYLQTTYKASSDPIDLYKAAQWKGADLVRALEAFLASTSPSPLLSSRLIPYPHRTLGLQYNTITPLESSLAPPIPGRMLGSRPVTSRNERLVNVASVLGVLATLTPGVSAGAAGTNWFPDEAGVRSNAPGRAAFRVQAHVNPSAFATRVALAAERGRKPLAERDPAHAPEALAERTLSLSPEVVSPGTPLPRLPGSREYSGELPPARRARAGAFDFDPASLLDASRRAGLGEARQLMAGRPSFQHQAERKQRAARLRRDRQREGRGGGGAEANRQRTSDSILESLSELLK